MTSNADYLEYWFHPSRRRAWASCPVTQAGYLRVAYQLLGETHGALSQALSGLEQSCLNSDPVLWGMDVDLGELSLAERGKLIGGSQITDMQLLMMAYGKKAQLVSADRGIKELARGMRFEGSLLLL